MHLKIMVVIVKELRIKIIFLTVKQENPSLGFVGSPKEIKQSIIEQIVKEKKFL